MFISDYSICVVYIGFHTLLYFDYLDFLALDNLFFCYDKGTRRNQNTFVNERNIVFCFTRSGALRVNIISEEQVLPTVKKLNHSPWQNTEVYRSHYRRNMPRFLVSLNKFFADVSPKQTEKFWNRLGILLSTYLATEFWRLLYHTVTM